MISYSTENVRMPAIRRRETTAWIRRVAATYNKTVGEVGYSCSVTTSTSSPSTANI